MKNHLGAPMIDCRLNCKATVICLSQIPHANDKVWNCLRFCIRSELVGFGSDVCHAVLQSKQMVSQMGVADFSAPPLCKQILCATHEAPEHYVQACEPLLADSELVEAALLYTISK